MHPFLQNQQKKDDVWKTISYQILTFINEFSQSFVYALPLIMMLAMEYLGIDCM